MHNYNNIQVLVPLVLERSLTQQQRENIVPVGFRGINVRTMNATMHYFFIILSMLVVMIKFSIGGTISSD